MTSADPLTILEQVGLWTAELHERGQVDDVVRAHLTEILTESLGERLDHEDDPLLVIMLCGPTAVGKSSLINALAGADISRPGLGATTRAAVLYVHEKDDPARLFEYSHLLGDSDQHETALVRHRRDELLHKVLVDTPDIDSVRRQHKELTTRLVHAADLVLFVTSPEKYKVMQSARWILAQRQQRAMAFVLNKWDRDALGLQRDRRQNVEVDFRALLAEEGFPDALLFKVSALTEPYGERRTEIENDLPALRAWLETGISQSTATTIRQRRLRAAWGRLAAAIKPAVPSALSGHPHLPEVVERLSRIGGLAAQGVDREASILDPIGLEDTGWPATPGLLGMWARTRHLVGKMASLGTGLSVLPAGDMGNRLLPLISGDAFGARSTTVLTEGAKQIVREASAEHLALGPVDAAWNMEITRLAGLLAVTPPDIAADITTAANRPSFRRFAGITSIYTIEVVIVVVLFTAAVRVGTDFVTGSYASEGMFVTAAELVLVLVVIGQITATLFFPPLRQRVRRTVAQRARSLVKAAIEQCQAFLREHVAAVDRLAREGQELLILINRTVNALADDSIGEISVDRLFGPPLIGLIEGQVTERTALLEAKVTDVEANDPVRRRPAFD